MVFPGKLTGMKANGKVMLFIRELISCPEYFFAPIYEHSTRESFVWNFPNWKTYSSWKQFRVLTLIHFNSFVRILISWSWFFFFWYNLLYLLLFQSNFQLNAAFFLGFLQDNRFNSFDVLFVPFLGSSLLRELWYE